LHCVTGCGFSPCRQARRAGEIAGLGARIMQVIGERARLACPRKTGVHDSQISREVVGSRCCAHASRFAVGDSHSPKSCVFRFLNMTRKHVMMVLSNADGLWQEYHRRHFGGEWSNPTKQDPFRASEPANCESCS
jgi:hypothetical protein